MYVDLTFWNILLQVTRTPPEIKRKREKEEVLKRNEEIPTLILTPFAAQPVLIFEDVKIGHSAVRKLAIRNPNSKPTKVGDEKIYAYLYVSKL